MTIYVETNYKTKDTYIQNYNATDRQQKNNKSKQNNEKQNTKQTTDQVHYTYVVDRHGNFDHL